MDDLTAIYLGFGLEDTPEINTPSNDFMLYVPATNEWMTLKSLLSDGRYAPTMFNINNKIYVCDGSGWSTSDADIPVTPQVTNGVWSSVASNLHNGDSIKCLADYGGHICFSGSPGTAYVNGSTYYLVGTGTGVLDQLGNCDGKLALTGSGTIYLWNGSGSMYSYFSGGGSEVFMDYGLPYFVPYDGTLRIVDGSNHSTTLGSAVASIYNTVMSVCVCGSNIYFIDWNTNTGVNSITIYDSGTQLPVTVASVPYGTTIEKIKSLGTDLYAITSDGSYNYYLYKLVSGSLVLQGTFDRVVYDIALYNGSLYAAGSFSLVDGVDVNCIAKLSGSTWGVVGLGLDNGSNDTIYALHSFGGSLYAAGFFTRVAGTSITAYGLAKWTE